MKLIPFFIISILICSSSGFLSYNLYEDDSKYILAEIEVSNRLTEADELKMWGYGISEMEITIPLHQNDSLRLETISLLESNIDGFNYIIDEEKIILTIKTGYQYGGLNQLLNTAIVNQSTISYFAQFHSSVYSMVLNESYSDFIIETQSNQFRDSGIKEFHNTWSELTELEVGQVKIKLEENVSTARANFYFAKYQLSPTTLCLYEIFIDYENNEILSGQTEVTLIPEFNHHCTNRGATDVENNPNIKLLDEEVV